MTSYDSLCYRKQIKVIAHVELELAACRDEVASLRLALQNERAAKSVAFSAVAELGHQQLAAATPEPVPQRDDDLNVTIENDPLWGLVKQVVSLLLFFFT